MPDNRFACPLVAAVIGIACLHAGPGALGAPIGWASEAGGTTGGAGGNTVIATTGAQFANYAEQNGPLIILVEGSLSHGGVEVASDKTISGIGSDAHAGRQRRGVASRTAERHAVSVRSGIRGS